MTMKKKVVVVIPTYNEALIIKETITLIFQVVQGLSEHEVSILVFDSASQDNTQKIVADLQNKYTHLYLQTEAHKSGLGAAYLTAMRYAIDKLDADVVVEFDADLSHQPKYLLPMIESMEYFDVVVGSRYVKGGSIPKKWAWHRKLLSRLGCFMARTLLTPKYKDFTSGFRATRTTVLKKILPPRFISSDFAYKLELLWLLHLNGAKILEMPIVFVDRDKGQSKLVPNNIINSMQVLLHLRFGKLARYSCMCMIGLTGMFAQFLIYNMSRLVINPFYAAQVAVTGALISNFILNDRITFKKMDQEYTGKKKISFATYVCFSVCMIFIQVYWLKHTVSLWGTGFWKENILLLMGIAIGSIVNYFAYSRVVWKDRCNQT